MRRTFFVLLAAALVACSSDPAPTPAPEAAPAPKAPAAPEAPAPAKPDPKHTALFQPLPDDMAGDRTLTEAKITLGRMLYYDARLSKNHDISCNTCHQLDKYGVDNEATSPGHKGARGDRNSPTTYNAALHIAQFWDGRAADVEAQAKGPVLAGVEMAMPNEAAVVSVLKSIPGYAPLFAAAFPDAEDPITYDAMAEAIGAFERKLVTPGKFDAYLKGDGDALTADEKAGLNAFVETGCTACHMGPAVGGSMYQKLGLVEPYPTEDVGRSAVTGNEAEKYFFKVPSLRNIAETGPYFHDGKVATLPEAISLMGKHQLGKELDEATVKSIETFLVALTGDLPTDYIQPPTLPESGPDTPAPDPT